MWLHAGKPGESVKPVDCERDCGIPGELNEGRRQIRGCTRVDLPECDWEVDPEDTAFYWGRGADRRLHLSVRGPLRVNWEKPYEDVEDGCPGGYQRAPLLGPLHTYYRRRTDTGNRVTNPFFDQCADWLIQSAILYLELEEERQHSEWLRCDNESRKPD